MEQSDRNRPKVSSPVSLLLGLLLGVSLILTIKEAVNFQIYVQERSCPQSSFEHGLLNVGAAVATAIPIFLLGCAILVMSVTLRLQRRTDTQDYFDADRIRWRKISIPVFFASVLVMIAGGLLWVNSVTNHFCATPDNILVQTGFLASPHTLAWEDVAVVYGTCTIYKYGTYGTLRLVFTNGEEVGLGLSVGSHHLMRDYEMIRKSLSVAHYRYYVNATVNPRTCSPEVYRLLWEWLNVS
jgi:hypothetical protein